MENEPSRQFTQKQFRTYNRMKSWYKEGWYQVGSAWFNPRKIEDAIPYYEDRLSRLYKRDEQLRRLKKRVKNGLKGIGEHGVRAGQYLARRIEQSLWTNAKYMVGEYDPVNHIIKGNEQIYSTKK